MELISVVITTYKRETEILKRAVDSVLKQTYQNLELIVVDDSPESYELREEVKEYMLAMPDERVMYYQHSKNMGACAARNTGIKIAKGKYLAFLDDDDAWLPNKLELQYSKIKEGYELVYCNNYIVNQVDETRNLIKTKEVEGKVFDELIIGNFIGSTSFPLLDRDAVIDVGCFDVEMRSAQDYDLWLRIAKKYRVGYVDQPLVDYYIHPGERITTNPDARILGLERLIAKNKEYLDKNKRVKSLRYFKIVPYYAAKRKYGKMIKYFVLGVLGNPFAVKQNYHIFVSMMRALIKKNPG